MDNSPAISQLIKDKVEQLRKLSFEDLCVLPESECDDVNIDEKKIALTTWMDMLGPKEVRVVFQCYEHTLLGVGWMSAHGFAKYSD